MKGHVNCIPRLDCTCNGFSVNCLYNTELSAGSALQFPDLLVPITCICLWFRFYFRAPEPEKGIDEQKER